MKKRKLILAVISLVSITLLPSCDIFEDCGTCWMVTVNADGSREETVPQLFCGDDFEDKLDFSPQTTNGKTIWWECE